MNMFYFEGFIYLWMFASFLTGKLALYFLVLLVIFFLLLLFSDVVIILSDSNLDLNWERTKIVLDEFLLKHVLGHAMT